MATAGETIENPVTGERFKWHQTAADTGGRLVRHEGWVRPGGGVRTEHVHRHSEERFELLAGRMALEIDGHRSTLAAGDSATAPAGVPHRWWNDGDDELHFVVEVDPPLRFELVIETMFRLAREVEELAIESFFPADAQTRGGAAAHAGYALCAVPAYDGNE